MVLQTPRRGLARAALAAAVILALMLWASVPATAHVHVEPITADAGSTVDLTFSVPSEHASASTVKVQVFFPVDNPVLQANAATVTGWTSTIEKDGSAVSSVAWEGGTIAPEGLQRFGLTIRVPDAAEIFAMRTEQTYSNGSVVTWGDPPANGPEPEHPAPAIRVLGAVTTTTTTSAATNTTIAETLTGDDAAAGEGDDSSGGLWFLAFGVVVLVLVTVRARVIASRERNRK